MILKFVSGTIKDKANFDIYKLDPLSKVSKEFSPAMFLVGKEDDFVEPKHT